MNRINKFFEMGFVTVNKSDNIILKKREGIVLTMSMKDLNEMNESQFIEFHNKVIDWFWK